MNSIKASAEKTPIDKSIASMAFSHKQYEEQRNMYLSEIVVLEKLYLNKDTTSKQKKIYEAQYKEAREKIENLDIEHRKILIEYLNLLPNFVEINKQKYELEMNTNVAVQIQDRYSSLGEWRQQVATITPSAVLNGALFMINENIKNYNEDVEIYNEENPDNKKPLKELLDEKIIGRQSLVSLFKPVLKRVLEQQCELGEGFNE